MRIFVFLTLTFFVQCCNLSKKEVADSGHLDKSDTEINALSPSEIVQYTDSLRSLYFARDYEGGVLEGRQLFELDGAEVLRAWYLINLARYRAAEKATDLAQELARQFPDDPWSWFALAGTSYRLEEDSERALNASARAVTLAPENPDILYLRGEVFRTKESPHSAIAFVDSVLSFVENPADLLVCKARALFDASGEYTNSPDHVLADSAFATFERARLIDPGNVSAFFIPGELLRNKQRVDEAFELLEQAAFLSPSSIGVQQEYCYAIQNRSDFSVEEKETRVRNIISRLLAERPETPEVLYKVAGLYGDIGENEERTAMEEQLLEIEPQGPRAEWILLSRIRRYERTHRDQLYGSGDQTIKHTYREMLDDFIRRDWHVRDDLLGEAYMHMFYLTDSTTSDIELLRIVEGMVRYEKLNPHIAFRRGALALAERGIHFREAERIARAGFLPMKENILTMEGYYDTEEELQSALDGANASMFGVLGWVFFHEGRLDEAEAELTKAYELCDGENWEILHHLGRLYETRYDQAIDEAVAQRGAPTDAGELAQNPEIESLYYSAFRFYQEGSLSQTPGENPNEKALEDLYLKRNGSLVGFEDFLNDISETDEAERHQTILEERIADPVALKPFRLEWLHGGYYDSSDLDGKITVINVWSTSCGPCLWEMPDLEHLYEQYVDDPDVRILTINKDNNPDDARQWVADNDVTLPVLIDSGYLDLMDVRAYPTTWFVDRDGQIAFIKIGWSKHLVEEFRWRIESLK